MRIMGEKPLQQKRELKWKSWVLHIIKSEATSARPVKKSSTCR